jgi:uncharacterized protein (DUF2336 family)
MAPKSLIFELEEAISSDATARNAEKLRRVIDLFVNGAVHFSEEQIAVFDDVIGYLADKIETAARAELAERLAPIPNAPPIVIRKLAFDDEIVVAAPVLTLSARLGDEVLIENAKTKSHGHLMAISRRQSVSAVVTDVIVQRGNREVVRCIAANSGAKFSQGGYSTLVHRSAGDDELSTCVGLRPDVPRNVYLQLLAKASERVREKLRVAHPHASREIQEVIASIGSRMASTAAATSRNYLAAQAVVASLHAGGKLGEADLMNFALAGKFEEATAALAQLCNVPVEFAERAMLQKRPETVLILCKAVGYSWPTIEALLELRVRGCGLAPSDLDECLKSFEFLKRPTAEKVLHLQRLGQKSNSRP